MVSTYSKMSLVKINASISILMKKLLILLFSFFLLSSPSVFAEDISDFEIKGISIGDSLLDYMTEDEILEGMKRTKDIYYYLNEPNKYVEVYLWEFPIYDKVSVKFKNNLSSKYITNKNNKYTILNVRGMIDYNQDFASCLVKRDEIASSLSSIFPNAEMTESNFLYPGDASGNSIVDGIYFKFATGDTASVACQNLEETFRNKMDFSEGLEVTIDTLEINDWLSDYK